MEGKRGVISGGTSGIGLAAAKLLVADGAHVFIVGRNAGRGKEALQALSDGKGRADYIQADVSTLAGCQKVAAVAGEGEAKVDFLVNCAGMYQEQPIDEITEETYQTLMDANVKSTIFLTKAMLPILNNQQPSILNIASDAALEGNYGCAVYAASKGAVVAFTRAAALDLSPWVRVNCICPGDVDTPLVEKQLEEGGYTMASMASIYPLGRIGKPEEIAHMICSVLSPLNGFMTGSILSVDGGLTAK
jgi:NAD(P)-dependent dehydrogenase (short-subunit alcohol dehydrogenase family)